MYFKRNFYLRFFFITAILFISGNLTGCASSGNGVNDESAAIGDSVSIEKYVPRFEGDQPVIAVVGDNKFTELTDYVVPWGILTEADIADVHALSIKEGPIQMFPALTIQPQQTVNDFDAQFPEGADYVIVPAVHNSDDPELLSWVRDQAEKGATIVGICDGVWVVAHAGLLENKKAVGHWYSLKKLGKKYPETEWVTNSRYMADENVITTTGVSASIPVSLALIEAIGGTERAEEVAETMGVDSWDATHNSSDFKLGGSNIFVGVRNLVTFWGHEDIGVPVTDDIDEIGLALLADAYSRTYRSKAFSVAPSGFDKPIQTRRGLVILPDNIADESSDIDRMLEPIHSNTPSAIVLDQTLEEIEEYYGRRTADFVALQLEYSQQ